MSSEKRQERVRGQKGKPPMQEEELRRNSLAIRFRDDEYKAVTDEAWRNRKTASGWLRDLVLERLELLAKAGVSIPNP